MIMPLCDYVSPATTALGRQAGCWEDAVRQAGALLEKGAFSARRAALESGFSGYQQMHRAVRRKQP